ncbi:LacI family DNA-binding transcriptional regulator [Arthrobacter sp. Sr24]
MAHLNRHSVTVIDVANEAGVSKSTASRVLAGQGSASQSAHQKVKAAAKKLGYTPNALAKAMVSGSSKTIGVVIPDVASPFFSTVVRGLSDAARTAGFEVIISNTDNDVDIETRSLALLDEKRVDGLIIAPVFQEKSRAIDALRESKLPLVFLDRRGPERSTTPLVSLDHISASLLATEHLLGLGHTRIAIVTEAGNQLEEVRSFDGDPRLLRPSIQRLLGYLRALDARNLDVNPDLVIHAEYDSVDAATAVRERFGSVSGITALYGTDSVLTSGAYHALLELGLRYPADVSFLGFDDQEWSTMVRPAVTVVSQPRYRIGATTATCLIEKIRHPEAQLGDILLPAKLIIRDSTAQPVKIGQRGLGPDQ